MTKRRRVNIKKIEEKTIAEIVNAEKAWRRHKAWARKFGCIPRPKEDFVKDFMMHQQPRIDAIKAIIAKYNDKKCPIMNSQCLEFRRLFFMRQTFVNTEEFSNSLTQAEWQLFYNHVSRCDSCSFYAVFHKDDAPIVANDLKEDGVSQSEFDKSLDEFYSTIKKQGDNLEQYESERGLRDIPTELMQHLSSEYSKTQKEED